MNHLQSGLCLLFFKGCPNVAVLKRLLHEEKVSSFTEIDLEMLPELDPLRSYSSPSLLQNGKLVLGSPTSNASLSCSFLSEAQMREALRRHISGPGPQEKLSVEISEICLKIEQAIREQPIDFVKVSPWNPKTIKVEVSSSAFEGIRRLDRFEMLGALLKEKVPELFTQYELIYKAFTPDEWEARKNKKA
jgi:stress-induced morphogen